MEIVRAFNSNSLHTDIVIKGTSDIGEVITIQNNDNTERHVSTVYTSIGLKNVCIKYFDLRHVHSMYTSTGVKNVCIKYFDLRHTH